MQAELDQILHFYNLPLPSFARSAPIRLISYVEMGNYYRVWLEEYEDAQEGYFYGLIVNGYVAGIAKMDKQERMAGYLNGDALCSYGVFIGASKALGVLRGENHQAIVDFIPLGSKIAIGDEVVTSGKDQIFFADIPVGRVTKIRDQGGYLSAEVDLYFKNYELGYMWLLDRSKDDQSVSGSIEKMPIQK